MRAIVTHCAQLRREPHRDSLAEIRCARQQTAATRESEREQTARPANDQRTLVSAKIEMNLNQASRDRERARRASDSLARIARAPERKRDYAKQ